MPQEVSPTIKDGAIRREYDQNSKKWHYSIVDIITLTTKSSDPRNYWKVLKNRLKKSHNELVTECNQLKIRANDGKFYLNDVATEETIIEIIKLVSPHHLSVLRDYFSSLPKSPSPVLQKNNFSDNFERSESDSYPQSRDATNTESVEDEDLMLAIDGYRENNFIIIQAFVAGTSIEDISVTLTCKTVMITGERNKIESEKISDENFSLQELCWGKFSRTIELPEEIDIEQAEVTEHHGLLSIRLPIINKNRSRSIKIKKALKLN